MPTRNRIITAAACVAVYLYAADAAFAQDTNYWTLQYGTRGQLLGGAVVGSKVDLSATYYNPGSLALVTDPSTILTASVFGMETVKVTDAAPDQEAVTSRETGPEPSLFAGTLPVKWFGGRWAYSFLTRQHLEVRLTAREGVVIALDEPGDSLSVGGEALFDQDLTETWGGLTWSRAVRENIGVGMTLYGVYRSQRRSVRQTVESIGSTTYGASLLNWTDTDYKAFRMLAKLGVSADFGKTTLGLAFTTRSLPLVGNGTILMNRVVVGDADLDGIDDSGAEVSYGTDLDAEYRSPFSIAVGGSYEWLSTTLHVTGEYFFEIDEYTVMETGVPATSPGVSTYESALYHGLDDVLNIGVGLERRFSEKTTAYISFLTDRSANRRDIQNNISLATWDIYHINGGVAFTLLGTDLTLGGGFAWGEEPLAFEPDSEGNLGPTVEPDAVSYSRIMAILGIAL